jgi:hypothetical protein
MGIAPVGVDIKCDAASANLRNQILQCSLGRRLFHKELDMHVDLPLKLICGFMRCGNLRTTGCGQRITHLEVALHPELP